MLNPPHGPLLCAASLKEGAAWVSCYIPMDTAPMVMYVTARKNIYLEYSPSDTRSFPFDISGFVFSL